MNAFVAGLLIVIALSAFGGWLFTAGKAIEKPVKVMMFVGYFWLLAFVQLSLLAAIYYLWQRF